MPSSLFELFFAAADYKSAYEEYAEFYAQSFIDEFFDGDGTFRGMESPKFYNFETDRIFVNISDEMLDQIWVETRPKDLIDTAKDRHTSRSGFISFYSPDTTTWGPYQEWDQNQLMTLLLAWLSDGFSEMDLVGDWETSIALWAQPKADRPWKIWNYLTYERKNRPNIT